MIYVYMYIYIYYVFVQEHGIHTPAHTHTHICMNQIQNNYSVVLFLSWPLCRVFIAMGLVRAICGSAFKGRLFLPLRFIMGGCKVPADLEERPVGVDAYPVFRVSRYSIGAG